MTELILPTVLFKAEWGSRAYGTNTEASDRDLIQVLIEPPRYITGLQEFRAQHTSTAEQGERSFAGDTDMVTYGLKKYAGLAVDGNPQVLATLYLTEFMEKNILFEGMQNYRNICLSKNAGRKYLGYMKSQRYNLEGLKKGKTNRPELVHAHGYDTKFAMHAVRLGFQGLELMLTHKINLPMQGKALEFCKAIRAGEVPKAEALRVMTELEAKLETAIEESPFPEQGNREMMSDLLHLIYKADWRQRGYADDQNE